MVHWVLSQYATGWKPSIVFKTSINSSEDFIASVSGGVVGAVVVGCVGFDVGLVVGSVVGFLVGLAVGSVVGFLVGLAVGSVVGLLVGFAVGSVVGFFVGSLALGITSTPISSD